MNGHNLAKKSFYLVVFLTILMIFLGGLTRLTRSGLSITEWKPILGTVPPFTQVHWEEAFKKYQVTPEYLKVNRGMSLDEFKFIYYMEWSHRFLGRLMGLALFIPFLILWLRKELTRDLIWKYLILFALLGLQGFLGWFMVRSGLVDIPRVSAYRLVIHLNAALLFLSVAWVFGLKAGMADEAIPGKSSFYKWAALALLIAIGIQIDLGGFTAGLRAGQVAGTFPKMNGEWIPTGVDALKPFVKNIFENPLMVHFLHRSFAWIVVLASIAFGVYGLIKTRTTRREKVWLIHLIALAALQFAVGIHVVLFHVPVSLASIHQLIAVGMWMAGLYVVFAGFRKPTG